MRKIVLFFAIVGVIKGEAQIAIGTIADSLYATGNFGKAIAQHPSTQSKKSYQKWIGADNSNSMAYFGMAEVLRKNKQPDSAEIYINKAMDVQRPIFAEGYTSLAGLARERYDQKSALEYYKLAYKETPSDEMLYFNICTVADQYYKDPKTKLDYYENFIKKFGKNRAYASKIVAKRINELKEELHFAQN